MQLRQKIRNIRDCYDNTSIYDAYYSSPIDENLIYFESRNGRDFTGNIFRIIEELSTGAYGDYKICVYATEKVKARILDFKKNYNLKIDRILTSKKDAAIALEKAKYVFTDSGIQTKYVKREGQIFVNTWHGTPLKLMGSDNVFEVPALGFIQHSLLSSDYLLYPNEYMCQKMTEAFMIEKIYSGKILLEGYPRNSIFFDESHASSLKDKLNLTDKEIFIYMPTFRGIVTDRDDEKQRDDVESYLFEIDSKLDDSQVLFAKLHAYNESQIDFNRFSHIRAFPKGYEIYEIINMGDVLITDYSSVFFDFANTSRKIIIFNYDEEDYLSYRGFYFPLDDLPFPKVRNVDDLIAEMNCPKEYDDTQFIKSFCSYDSINASKNICRHIFKNENVCKEIRLANENPNILIYAGDLSDGKITDSIISLLDKADRKANNFFITFKPWDENIKKNFKDILNMFPRDVEFLPFKSNLIPTIREKMDYDKFFENNSTNNIPDSLKRLFKRSYDKQYGAVDFDFALDFYGIDSDVSMILASSQNSIIWLHDNAFNTNQNPNVIREILNSFDLIVTDSDKLAEKLSEITQNGKNIEVFKSD
ncbi:CDP-glycerol glycerophosphotransferase family protein [Methanobrevibacter sp.]|uniref:CDP-glycerol glycerophosphotransferase family protein n=1 Tax=Methanobrevibacter sp. TaxID=66852 RepID=UPI0025FB2F0F|nr:CDP-glycerol glycerophosphotransferase family protein [Methanobrevibacter sp.]MBQ6512551.1 CDP-glycerol glycerophosphotransferase family protein [Methanobrevibacter sp.]